MTTQTFKPEIFLQRAFSELKAEKKCSLQAQEKIKEVFASCGYNDHNKKLFDILCKLGGSELESTTKKGLMLKGDKGTGKSFGLEILSKYFGWEFRNIADIEGFYKNQPSFAEWEFYCRACDFFERPHTLVIDDLGLEKFPLVLYGSVCNPLAELLEIRYRVSYSRDNVRTIITTNLTENEIIERYGDRISDRFKEMLSVITIQGESLRR